MRQRCVTMTFARHAAGHDACSASEPFLPFAVMPDYKLSKVPKDGDRIGYRDGELVVPDTPVIPFIEGDGTGPDIWRASVRVFDAAVRIAFGGKRRVAWMEVFAGE